MTDPDLTPEQLYELNMELNASYERLSEKHEAARVANQEIQEEELVRDSILRAMGSRRYDVT